ncbi:MAG: hypothetical protein RR197_03070 [Oscillospiraceae bacterium]
MGAIMVILDGMGDQPCSSLGNRTPLEAAFTPALDALRARGAHGRLRATPAGVEPESVACILSLLGVAPNALPLHARAWLEALSHGLAVEANDLVLRCSLSSFDSDDRLIASDGGAIPADFVPPPLPGLEFFSLGSYKGLLLLRGRARDLAALRTFAPHQHDGAAFEALLVRGGETAELLSAFMVQSHRTLGHRALIAWGESMPCALPAFPLAGAAAVCAAHVVRGLCLARGMTVVTPPGATADTDTDLSAKLHAALLLAQTAPFVLLHLNGADEAAHRRDPRGKAEFLSKIDRELLAPLAQTDLPLLICADHATSSLTGAHTPEPQPFVLRRADRRGDLGLLDANQAVPLLCGAGRED